MSDQVPTNWLGDDAAAAGLGVDEILGRKPFAQSAVALLNALRDQSESAVAALVGPWGSGKSTILNLIKTELRSTTPEWIVVEFNPWFYSDQKLLELGFFRELTAALPTKLNWQTIRARVVELGQALMPAASLDPTGILETVASYAQNDHTTVQVQKARIDSLLKAADQPVLMILDDLDRLTPDELLLTLKLIRLTGRMYNVYYLVSYDEQTLLSTLGHTGLIESGDRRLGIDYLEKIIQVRLDLPPMRPSQALNWINAGLDAFSRQFSVEIEQGESRFQQAYAAHLRSRLITPRSIKRYFGQAIALFEAIKDEVDAVDFLLVSWLRTAEPLVYELLVRRRDDLLGTASAYLNRPVQNDELRQVKADWAGSLALAKVEPRHIEGVARILGLLFPNFDAAWAERPRNPRSSEVDKSQRVCNPNYFDRYFAFSVPADDVPDAVVRAAYSQLVSGVIDRSELARVQTLLLKNAALVIGKLYDSFEEDSSGGAELLAWLRQQYYLLPDERSALMSARGSVTAFSSMIFTDLSTAQVKQVMRLAAHERSRALPLMAHWIRAADNTDRSGSPQELVDALADAKRELVRLIVDEFNSWQQRNVFDVPRDSWGLLWDWVNHDAVSAREWFRSLADTPGWTSLNILGRLVSTRILMGVPDAQPQMDQLSFDMVDAIIGIDEVTAMYSDEIRSAVKLEPGAVDSPDNRTQFALWALRQRTAPAPAKFGSGGSAG